MNSEPEHIISPSVKARHEQGMKELRDMIVDRKEMIEKIYLRAVHHGLIVDRDKVARCYPWFYRWYTGNIATGYLMRRTGVKKAPFAPEKKRK